MQFILRFPQTQIAHTKKALLTLLSEFKLYRKYKGGKWYFVIYKTDNTLEGVSSHWTRVPVEGEEVKWEEVYTAIIEVTTAEELKQIEQDIEKILGS